MNEHGTKKIHALLKAAIILSLAENVSVAKILFFFRGSPKKHSKKEKSVLKSVGGRGDVSPQRQFSKFSLSYLFDLPWILLHLCDSHQRTVGFNNNDNQRRCNGSHVCLHGREFPLLGCHAALTA